MAILKEAESGTLIPELCRGIWHEFSHILQVALQIRWYGRLANKTPERIGRGEP